MAGFTHTAVILPPLAYTAIHIGTHDSTHIGHCQQHIQVQQQRPAFLVSSLAIQISDLNMLGRSTSLFKAHGCMSLNANMQPPWTWHAMLTVYRSESSCTHIKLGEVVRRVAYIHGKAGSLVSLCRFLQDGSDVALACHPQQPTLLVEQLVHLLRAPASRILDVQNNSRIQVSTPCSHHQPVKKSTKQSSLTHQREMGEQAGTSS